MTILLIIFTSAISIVMFRKPLGFSKFQLNAYQTYHQKEYYRLISHGFLHVDWIHLIVNMIVLLSFGIEIEKQFRYLELAGHISNSRLWYLLFYLSAIVVSSLVTVVKMRNIYHYNSVGASGAVSAIVFAAILFSPVNQIYFFGVVPLPGIIFGIIYLGYSQYMSMTNKDDINHDAHFAGAVYGFVFPILLNPDLFLQFVHQIKNLVH